jgi:hypothetical protein
VRTVREVEFRRRKLIATFAKIRQLDRVADSSELQAECARHLCVLVSGFVERSIAEIILAYAEDRAAPILRSYIDTTLRRLTNVDKERLLTVVGSLDARWRSELDLFVVDKRLAALNSVVGLRNDIAHGGSGSISLDQVERYWTTIQEIIDKLEQLVLPNLRANARRGGGRAR